MTIVAEHVIKVEQDLLGLPGTKLEDIKMVYSHPQGLMQSAKFLEEHSYMSTKSYSSTSGAAKKVAEDGDRTQAAIASARAAKKFGLEILQKAVNFENQNYTRFIIITNQKVYLSNANKLSLCFEVKHQVGALYNMLANFYYNDLNLTKIESRPIPEKKWEYRFFVDFEGNLSDSGVKNALYGISREVNNLRILGNY